MEQPLSLMTLKESAARKEASLQEKARQLEAAQAALDAQVRKLQEDQRMGAQRIIDWACEASSALVPLGMSPIQVAEPQASIADALPVLNSASDRLRHLEAEGRELCRMVAKYILTCLRSHDPAISQAPVVDGPMAKDGGHRSRKRARCRRLRSRLFQAGACRFLSWTITAGDLLFFVLCKNIELVETLIEENFNLAVCQLLWFAICSTPAPWPPGR